MLIGTVRAAANTSTGTQDFTTTDLAGKTPKAAILIATRATADATAVDGASICFGFTDGTNTWGLAHEDEHNQDTTDVWEVATTNVLTIYDGTADVVVDGAASFSAWITNGIRINWTDAPAAGYLVTAILFAGDDLTVKAGNTALGNTLDLATDLDVQAAFEISSYANLKTPIVFNAPLMSAVMAVSLVVTGVMLVLLVLSFRLPQK